MNRKTTIDQEATILLRYLKGAPGPELAREYNVSSVTIYNIVRRTGGRIRDAQESHTTKSLDATAFDILTEESAYWLGFLMADGVVFHPQRGQPTLKLCLGRKDVEHVKAFRLFLKSNHEITDYDAYCQGKAFPASSFTVSSSRLVDKISEYGIVANKGKSGAETKIIGLEDDRNFWRGMVDGDGTLREISRNKNRNKYPWIELTGTRGNVESFREFVLQYASRCRATVRPNNRGSFRFQLGGSVAGDMIHVIYEGCKVALPRKLKTARRLMSDFDSQFNVRHVRRGGN